MNLWHNVIPREFEFRSLSEVFSPRSVSDQRVRETEIPGGREVGSGGCLGHLGTVRASAARGRGRGVMILWH